MAVTLTPVPIGRRAGLPRPRWAQPQAAAGRRPSPRQAALGGDQMRERPLGRFPSSWSSRSRTIQRSGPTILAVPTPTSARPMPAPPTTPTTMTVARTLIRRRLSLASSRAPGRPVPTSTPLVAAVRHGSSSAPSKRLNCALVAQVRRSISFTSTRWPSVTRRCALSPLPQPRRSARLGSRRPSASRRRARSSLGSDGPSENPTQVRLTLRLRRGADAESAGGSDAGGRVGGAPAAAPPPLPWHECAPHP